MNLASWKPTNTMAREYPHLGSVHAWGRRRRNPKLRKRFEAYGCLVEIGGVNYWHDERTGKCLDDMARGVFDPPEFD